MTQPPPVEPDDDLPPWLIERYRHALRDIHDHATEEDS